MGCGAGGGGAGCADAAGRTSPLGGDGSGDGDAGGSATMSNGKAIGPAPALENDGTLTLIRTEIDGGNGNGATGADGHDGGGGGEGGSGGAGGAGDKNVAPGNGGPGGIGLSGLATLVMTGAPGANVGTGTVVVETVFAWPGVGRLLVSAASSRDLAVVQALVLFTGIVMIAANLTVDLLYGVLDPRIRVSR